MQPNLFTPEPAMAPDEIRFTVYGKAQPAGSKSSFVPIDKRTGQPFKKNGRVIVNTVDANPNAKDWKTLVALSARQNYSGELLRVPLSVKMWFYQTRPKCHYGSGRNAALLKESAPVYPSGKPDVLKLARGVEDALTGVVWQDDSLIVAEELHKWYGEFARVEIVIRPL